MPPADLAAQRKDDSEKSRRFSAFLSFLFEKASTDFEPRHVPKKINRRFPIKSSVHLFYHLLPKRKCPQITWHML